MKPNQEVKTLQASYKVTLESFNSMLMQSWLILHSTTAKMMKHFIQGFLRRLNQQPVTHRHA